VERSNNAAGIAFTAHKQENFGSKQRRIYVSVRKTKHHIDEINEKTIGRTIDETILDLEESGRC
jgi:hypothetical protein